MHIMHIILSLIDDEVWKKIGGSFEYSQTWLAIVHGFAVLEEEDAEAQRMKNNVDGTGYDVPEEDGKINEDGERVYTWRPFEHYETEENTSPYINISHAEKFQRACYLLRWMDENEEFHFYMKGNEKVQRHRPSVDEEVEKFLKAELSEKEREDMIEQFGQGYADNWFAEISKEGNAKFERYGKELVQLIHNERCTNLNDKGGDWNMSDFAEDTAGRLIPKIELLVAGDKTKNIPSLPEKYGHTTPWVRRVVWKLIQLEKALSAQIDGGFRTTNDCPDYLRS